MTRHVVQRRHLLARLEAARRKSCILIQGPAGSGKTTLVAQWRAMAMSYGYDLAAMTVSPGDDCDRVADGMFACLDRVDTALASEAAFVYNRGGESRSPEPAAIAIIRAVTKHPRELVLVIDDYHLVHDAMAHRLVQMLLDLAPPNFHVVLVSRSVPALSLARMRDKAALLELEFADLRFTLSESDELLRGQHADVAPSDVRQLHELTGGWAAGLGLVAFTMGSQPRPQKHAFSARLQNAHDFRAYFNDNVLAGMPAADVSALTRLAAASRFDEGLCAALVGADAGQGLLERLRRDNVFLIPVEGKEAGSWYRFHPLFRDQLKELFERLPRDAQRHTHLALSEVFGRRDQLREAVHHCVAAGEADRAADWVERCAQNLFLNGELRRLVRAVAELPAKVLHPRNALQLWVAWSQLCYRQLDACRESVANLNVSLPPNDRKGHYHLALLELSLALQKDDTEAAERLLPALDEVLPSHDAVLAGGRRNILGWYHGQRNEGPLAREKLAGPHFLRDNGQPLLDSAFGFLVGECLKGYSYVKEGDMRQAERALRKTLRESEAVLGPFCEAAANAAGFLTPVLYEFDELPALRALLDTRMDLIERAGLPDAVICARLMHSRMCQSEGNLQEATADIDRLEEIARRRGLDRTLSLALAERVAIRIRMGDTTAAEEPLAELRAMKSQQSGKTSNAALSVWWHASAAQMDLLIARRHDHEALAALQNMLDHGIFEEKLQARVQLFARKAMLLARLHHRGEAQAEMVKALGIAQRMGLVRSLLDLGEEVLQLGETASQSGLLDSATRFHWEYVTQRAREQASRRADPKPLPNGRLSQREIDIVKALAAAMPNKRIAQALDISPDTVKWHLKNVYAKLGVYARDSAVMRARELGYVDSHSS